MNTHEDQTAAFRQAMRGLAGQVSVITLCTTEGRTGFTATTAFCFDVDPPTMGVSIGCESSSWRFLRGCEGFGINVLAEDQADVAVSFAGTTGATGVTRYSTGAWHFSRHGYLSLDGVVTFVGCRIEEAIVRNSRALLLGSVVEFEAHPRRPLLYWNTRYFGIGKDERAEPALAQPMPREV